MHYLSDGLKEMGLGAGGKVLAILFALMCIGGSLGGGNMFQGNQSFQAIADLPTPRVFDALRRGRSSIRTPQRSY